MSRKMELAGRNESMELFRLETEPFGTNTYVVICRESSKSLLVDTPGDAQAIKEKLKDTAVQYILLTHGHPDHVMALEELYYALEAPLAAHQGDAGRLPVKADQLLRDGYTIECGKLALKVMHTPGHTPGSLCFLIGKYLLSGDTIFPGGPGKTNSPQDFKTIYASIREKILTLPNETIVLPGHGEPTDIGTERALIEQFEAAGYNEDLCGDVTWLGGT